MVSKNLKMDYPTSLRYHFARHRRRRFKLQNKYLVLCSFLLYTSLIGSSPLHNAYAFISPTKNRPRYFLNRYHMLDKREDFGTPKSPTTLLSYGLSKSGQHSNTIFNVGYDANSIIDFYDRRPWEVGLRLNMLGLPLLGAFYNTIIQFHSPMFVSSIYWWICIITIMSF